MRRKKLKYILEIQQILDEEYKQMGLDELPILFVTEEQDKEKGDCDEDTFVIEEFQM